MSVSEVRKMNARSNCEQSPFPGWIKRFISVLARLLLFFAIYIAANIVEWVMARQVLFPGGLQQIVQTVMDWMSFLFFPQGWYKLLVPLVHIHLQLGGEQSAFLVYVFILLLAILSLPIWVMYLVISLSGSLARSRVVFAILFGVFVVLLTVNIILNLYGAVSFLSLD